MKSWGRYYAAAMLAGILVAGAGCAKAPTDSQLSDQIRAKLKQDSGLQDKTIAVEISKGVVTLSGTVDNETERGAASRYASTTPGITEVVNNLQVAPAAASMGPVAAPAPGSAPPPDPEVAKPVAPVKPSAAPRRRANEASSRQSSSQRSSSQQSVPDQSMADQSDPAPKAVSTDSSAVKAKLVAEQQTVAQAQPPRESADAMPDAPAAPAAPTMMTIESGTTMAIRLVDEIDSETAKQGQTFRATLDSPLSAEWDVAIPSGYDVEGHVVEVKSAGKFAGQSELVLTLDKILVRDKTYQIQTDDYRRKGKNQTTKTAEKVGVGAAIGAIIGGIAGGGKGAGIGAAAGGGLGGATQAASKGQPVRLESETVLHFTLQSPVTVARVEASPERRKLPSAKD